MKNNKTILRAILSVAIIVAFFLPWFKYGGGSGLDLVTSSNTAESTETTIVRYSFLLIPFFALVVLIRSVNNRSSNFLLRLLPFLVTGILTALFIMGINLNGGSSEELKGWLQIIDYGLYIIAVASLLLVFI
jgi:Ca2+/H+ antiporter